MGIRHWNMAGHLELETPLKDGQQHGVAYTWYAKGRLNAAEPYTHGLPHGIARQWAENGRLLGTYSMENGSGIDLWRDLRADGSAYLAEARYSKGGKLHGPEWWINEDQTSVFTERHWQDGKLHGIERVWTGGAKLDDGYPKFWVVGEEVSRETYQESAAREPSLPAIHDPDDLPRRRFPAEVESALGR